MHACTHTHMALWISAGKPGEPEPAETFTHSTYRHPLSPSAIYYDPWHPPCSIYVPDSLFPQSLSKFSLVYLLAWHPQLHTPCISSPNHCLLFVAHAHTIAICFAVVPRLCLSQPFTWNSISCSLTPHLSNHSHLCLIKCHLTLLSYGTGLTCMQHTTLHTTAVQSPSHYQWYIGIGKQ